MNLLYFGLPLGALALARAGHVPRAVVLSPVDAPGRRRLRRVVKGPIIEVGAEPDWMRAVGALSAGLDSGERLSNARRSDLSCSHVPFDLVVSWYFTRRVPKSAWQHARFGALGVHPSLLPRHRGPNPFFWAIDSGDLLTGATLHLLDEEYDTGAVLAQQVVEVGERNSWQLARALDRPSLELLCAGVDRLARGEPFLACPQDIERASWAPEPTAEALRVDWQWGVDRVLRRIRALAPVPGLAVEVWGFPLFATRAERAPAFPRALNPGEACLEGRPARAVLVRCGDGAIRITRLTLGEITSIQPDLEHLRTPPAEATSEENASARSAHAQDGTPLVDLVSMGTGLDLRGLVARELPAEQLLPLLLQACPAMAGCVFGE